MRTRLFFAKSPLRMLEATIGTVDLSKLQSEEYWYVATFDAESPEAAFEHCQNLDIPWRDETRSMSCGDILYMEDRFWFCASTGFLRLEVSDFTSALYTMAVRAEMAAAKK